MSWKRCWNGGYNHHNFYESPDFDEQIVPDIDRRPTSTSSSSSLSSNSSMDNALSSLTSTRGGGGIDPHYHHHQAPVNSGHHHALTGAAAQAVSSPTSLRRAFPSKRDTNGLGNDPTSGIGGASTGAHYRVFGHLKAAPSVFSSSNHNNNHNNNNGHSSALQSAINSVGNVYNSTASTASPWSSHKSTHTASDFFGSRNGEKRSGLELNDFWEEKYSRIAVITTTNHFGQTMSNKL